MATPVAPEIYIPAFDWGLDTGVEGWMYCSDACGGAGAGAAGGGILVPFHRAMPLIPEKRATASVEILAFCFMVILFGFNNKCKHFHAYSG
jgi:hypothetical protein